MPRRSQPTGARRIEKSERGRLMWHPGQQHPLDILFEDARAAQEELPAHLETLLSTAQRVSLRLHTLLDQEQALQEPAQALTAADHEASRQLLERFSDRKHVDHLRALFALLRRRRLRARMQAIQAVLDLALGLLGVVKE